MSALSNLTAELSIVHVAHDTLLTISARCVVRDLPTIAHWPLERCGKQFAVQRGSCKTLKTRLSIGLLLLLFFFIDNRLQILIHAYSLYKDLCHIENQLLLLTSKDTEAGVPTTLLTAKTKTRIGTWNIRTLYA